MHAHAREVMTKSTFHSTLHAGVERLAAAELRFDRFRLDVFVACAARTRFEKELSDTAERFADAAEQAADNAADARQHTAESAEETHHSKLALQLVRHAGDFSSRGPQPDGAANARADRVDVLSCRRCSGCFGRVAAQPALEAMRLKRAITFERARDVRTSLRAATDALELGVSGGTRRCTQLVEK